MLKTSPETTTAYLTQTLVYFSDSTKEFKSIGSLPAAYAGNAAQKLIRGADSYTLPTSVRWPNLHVAQSPLVQALMARAAEAKPLVRRPAVDSYGIHPVFDRTVKVLAVNDEMVTYRLSDGEGSRQYTVLTTSLENWNMNFCGPKAEA